MILDQLLAYVQLDDADRARLIGLHDRIAPDFPRIAERFYEAVWANPDAARVLDGPDQVERLRRLLIDWMSSGLLGPYDLAFNERRSRIGRRHITIGLAQQYMFTAMNVVRAAYLDRISALYPAAEALLIVRSVDKLFDVELALMLRHYQLDSEERLIARERKNQTDRLTALQTMTAGLAHEIRNPLNAAKLQLELLGRRLRRAGDDPKMIDPVELAHHEIQRLTNLLNEFLSFARPAEAHRRDHDVVVIARHVIELESAFAEHTGVALTLTGAPTAVATIDAGRLHQVLQNLVRNALEASPAGTEVTVDIALTGGRLHLAVTDHGAGMSDETRARIYEPFFSTKEGGTGMGMAIVHNFIAMHGGTIEIATGPDGTRIDVAIPSHG
jgi:two-component system sensor histidine kinase HydH